MECEKLPAAPVVAARFFVGSNEDRKVQSFGRTEPDDMLRVIGKVVSAQPVGEDRQAPARFRGPDCELRELGRAQGELARSARMRADRIEMEMADRAAEPVPRTGRERLGFGQLGRIEVDVRVEAAKGHPNSSFALRSAANVSAALSPPQRA